MLRILAFAALVAGTGAALHFSTSADAAQAVACQELYRHEPVLLHDVTGGTLLGPYHTQLAVYNDGFVSFHSVTGLGTPVVEARTAYVGPEAVQALQKALQAAGAFGLCDQPLQVSDVPLQTLTVFRGDGDAYAHSFSYWLGTGPHAAANAAVQDFVQTWLP